MALVGLEARRSFLLGALGAVASACASSHAATTGVPASAASPAPPRAPGALQGIEARIGGRLGAFVLDTGSGRAWAHRADERFAMCSTFKWVLAACVLDRAARAQLSLDERIAYGPADLLEYAPVCREHLGEGSLSLEALARAAVTVSDNTAANLLLATLGGPAAFTRYARSLGDATTRLDRNEPALNANAPGDERDTTTPRAMASLLHRLLCGDALPAAHRELLLGWMTLSETGKKRIRAGLPAAWGAGDKTGTGNDGAVNDVAIALPPGRAPLLFAVYLSGSASELDALEAAHADVGRVIVAELGA